MTASFKPKINIVGRPAFVLLILIICLLFASSCKQVSNFAPAGPDDPPLEVTGYKVNYSADANTDASLTLYLQGGQTITKTIGQAQIAGLVSMLNGSSVSYHVKANVYEITPKPGSHA